MRHALLVVLMAVATTALAQQRSDPTAVEIEFWSSVKDSRSAEELNAYLERYPNGHFTALARARLRALSSASSAPPPGDAWQPVQALKVSELSRGTAAMLLKECVPQHSASEDTVAKLFTDTSNFTTSFARHDAKTYFLVRSRGIQKKGACLQISPAGYAIVPTDVFDAAVKIDEADPALRQKWFEGIQADLARTGNAAALIQFTNGNASELTFAIDQRDAHVIRFSDRFMKAGEFNPGVYANVVSTSKAYTVTTMTRGNAKVMPLLKD